MNESGITRISASILAVSSLGSSTHKKLGFHTAHGTEWFEFSPMKMKEYFYELASDWASHTLRDDISFSTLLDMSSISIDSLEDGVHLDTNLHAILDQKAKEDARIDMLRHVCGYVYHKTEYEMLRYQVNKLVETDLRAACVGFNPNSDVLTNSSLMALHLARLDLTRHTQETEDEFCIHLYKLVKRKLGSLIILKLHFAYSINFEIFLSRLTKETDIQKDEGFNLDVGPWKYSMLLDGQIEGAWSNLTDEKSFQELLHKLGNSQGEAAMIHAVDYAIERQHHQNTKKTEKEDKWAYRKEELGLYESEDPILDADGTHFFCGLTFMEHLAEKSE